MGNKKSSQSPSCNQSKSYHYGDLKSQYKIMMLGGGGVGKSACTIQLIQGHFMDEYDPTIEDSYRKQVKIGEKETVLDILDTAGKEEFSAMRDQYLRNAEGMIIVYSITSRDSFDEISIFRDQVLRVKDEDFFPLVLIGNKCDLEDEREVTRKEAEEMAKSWNIPFFETSAKMNTNVNEAFLSIIEEIRKRTSSFGSK
eukprot:TRINITY_DN979_c0_g2_i8.p1 TRINITY_DN979_c0_g2~~TRINITY_DN979_c0_g2_i8.p1  ORF type:complete len:198 (-),score=35.34 TRINITY_DN979_c0_g2_i8:38-631(-)